MNQGIWYNSNVVVCALERLGVRYVLNSDGKKLSTLKCGGTIKMMILPNSVEQLVVVINLLQKEGCPFYVLGKGSNTLIKDGTINTIVLNLKNLNSLSLSETVITAGCGLSLSKLVNYSIENSLQGMERFCGIPASIGGITVKNAGCYGTETENCIKMVEFIDLKSLKIDRAYKEEIPYSYRTSNGFFNDKIVTSCEFQFEKTTANLKDEIRKYMQKRKETQPQEPSLGSVFKRIDGVSAGYYIDKANLKGVSIGGAMISNKHANFFLNHAQATATDYLKLIDLAKTVVRHKYNITLNEEIDILGD